MGGYMIPLSFYQDNGATSDCLQDAEREFLIAQGETEGHNQDMWFEFLRLLGYTGSLYDMQYEFYVTDEGAIPATSIDYDAAWGAAYTADWNENYIQGWA